MASLSTTGAHCAAAGCHQFDFLPFACAFCQLQFCLDHRTQAAHDCFSSDPLYSSNLPTCPVCNQVVLITKDEDRDRGMSLHIDSQCKLKTLKEYRKQRKELLKPKLRCDYVYPPDNNNGVDSSPERKCENRQGQTTLICKECTKQFCLSHRLTTQHNCASLKRSISSPSPFSSFFSSSSSSSKSPPPTTTSPTKPKAGASLLEKVKKERQEKESKGQSKPYLTLQQIRASMKSMFSPTASVVDDSSESATSSASSSPPPPQSQVNPSSETSTATLSVTKKSTSSLPILTALPSGPAPTTSQIARFRTMCKQNPYHCDEKINEKERYYLEIDMTEVKNHFYQLSLLNKSAGNSQSSKLKFPSKAILWMNKSWSIGKCLDFICEAFDIENINILSSSQYRFAITIERTLGKFERDPKLYQKSEETKEQNNGTSGSSTRRKFTSLPFELTLIQLSPIVLNGDQLKVIVAMDG